MKCVLLYRAAINRRTIHDHLFHPSGVDKPLPLNSLLYFRDASPNMPGGVFRIAPQ